MSPWLESLDKELIKDCLRRLKDPQFTAKAHLLRALASVDGKTHEPNGVVKVNPQRWIWRISFGRVVWHPVQQLGLSSTRLPFCRS